MNTHEDSYYFVRRGTERLGKLNSSEIVHLLKDGDAFFEIQVLDESVHRWQPLSDVRGLSHQVAQSLVNAPNGPSEGYSSFSNWKIAGSQKGPYNFLALVQYIQQGQVPRDEWVQHPRLDRPVQIKDLVLFQNTNVETLFDFDGLRPLFEKRKNIRIPYENRVLVYDESGYYSGSTWSLSSKGLGVVLDPGMVFSPGKSLKLHIHKNHNHVAVQVLCTVVSRAEDDFSTRLGLVFEHSVDSLDEYIRDVAP